MQVSRFQNNGIRFFKLRLVDTNIPPGLTNVLNNPTPYPDWSNVSALFEYYKVNAMKLKWIPHNTEAISNQQPHNIPIYIIHDWNNVNETFTQAFFIAHEKLTIKQSHKPWSYFRNLKITAPPYLQSEGSFNGYLRTASPVPTNVIRLWNTATIAGQNLGSLIVTLYMTCMYRQ